MQRGYGTLIGVYSHEEGRENDIEEFYEELLKCLKRISVNDYVIIARDLNERIVNHPIHGVIGKHFHSR